MLPKIHKEELAFRLIFNGCNNYQRLIFTIENMNDNGIHFFYLNIIIEDNITNEEDRSNIKFQANIQ